MFTGIIEEVGKIIALGASRGAKKLTIQAGKVLDDLKADDSIAINGVCLTVIDKKRTCFSVEAVEETLSKTTIGHWRPDGEVNLERALRASNRLGGHFVQGHVDGVARVNGWQKQAGGALLTIEMPGDLKKYLVPKGSITVDGVSLTIANLTGSKVKIALVPHTLAVTTLGKLKMNEQVNIETDMMGKYVYHILNPYQEQQKKNYSSFDVKTED
jgi:riboflavin synthase